jgi:glycosyltransferase involved in cell wall biosynthesis
VHTAKPLKVLFISRAYPPVIGGIEKQNHEIAQALGKIAHVEIIANRRGKKFLPFFLVFAFFRMLTILPKVDVVLLGDGVLAVLGYVIKQLSAKPVVCIIHGLDITFPQAIYQRLWLQRFLPALDKYIAVGNETIRQAELRGLDRSKMVFIGNGVSHIRSMAHYQRGDLQSLTGSSLNGKVMLTLGRLVRRKGVEWFICEVMPLLPNDITYIIAGDGREFENIEEAIKSHHLTGRVICLGAVTEQQKQLLLNTVDLFVQPNIPVEGDMEGFGLVVLEAAMAGRVVVASALEGLQDAIHEGRNGFLLPAGDAQAYQQTIRRLLQDTQALQGLGEAAAHYVREHFSWDCVAQSYLKVLQEAR